MADVWSEIQTAEAENRHELILSGSDISSRIEDDGLDKYLFKLTHLNFLEISKTCLKAVPDEIGQLTNLFNLVLHSNQLVELPSSIGKLTKLKVLDVSRNKLTKLPSELQDIQTLNSINVASNELTSEEIPSFSKLVNLLVLNLSHNKLETFPDVCYPELSHLSEIKLQGNMIKETPHTISNLVALKLFDLQDNGTTGLPGELALCTKLKDLELQGNKFSDRRFQKLVENKTKPTCKQLTDYIAKNFPKCEGENSDGKKKGKGKKGKGQADSTNKTESDGINDEIRILRDGDSTPTITVMEVTKEVRPFIVCCILHNIELTEQSFRHFIQIQTKLHESVCDKRVGATIATHDLNKINGPITYDAKPPSELRIHALGQSKDISGQELFRKLQREAEAARKASKRNTYSGIHKYLNLLEDKSVYPCLLDSNGMVISFPPLTNSEDTKISSETKSMLLEVTSSISLQNCKKVLEALLLETLSLGICSNQDNGTNKQLTVEQVRVVDSEGRLKVIYPSRTDLQIEENGVIVTRNS